MIVNMKYETTLFTAEFNIQEGGPVWVTDRDTGETASLEGAFAGDLGVSPLIEKELEEIDNYFLDSE